MSASHCNRMGQMNAKERARFEALLRQERVRIINLLGAIAAPTNDFDAPGDDGQPGAAGAGPNDDAAVIARETAALADVDAALQLLRDSPERYGRCSICRRTISAARLSIVPATRTCQRHAVARADTLRHRSTRTSGAG